MKNIKKLIALILTLTFALGLGFAGVEAFAEEENNGPKYIFLFIGDGMSYPQFQLTANYLGALKEPNPEVLQGPVQLCFVDFTVAGSANTYDSTSFCPDSASTATSIASGHKTHSGTINLDVEKEIVFETIAEKLHKQKDYKIGIVTSVNLNHATPAAFYAHQPSRGNYYEIGLELVESGFEYFAGGAMLSPTGKEKDQKDIYEIMEEGGYNVIKTAAEVEGVTADSTPVVIIEENLADSNAFPYEIDRAEDALSLADYTRKGIEVLNNDTGFFMMVEGGKIDWACHANDAATTIHDTIAFADAVQVAIDFAAEHPEDTLILVTGDHETGGLSIGYAGTWYDTFLHLIGDQKISYAKFNSDVLPALLENEPDFATALETVEEYFGLKAEGAEDDVTVLSEYELEILEESFNRTVADHKALAEEEEADEYTTRESLMYGGYEPFTITITHIVNNKCGIDFTSYAHTGLPVAVFAQGNGADLFKGYYENTAIFDKLVELTGVE